MLGDRALLHLIDGAVPEFEPAQEVTGGERMPVMDGLMSAHRAAPIECRAEQNGLPEVAHDREVQFEAVPPDFGEWFRNKKRRRFSSPPLFLRRLWLSFYASMTATMRRVSGSMMTISSPTRMNW